MWQYRKNYMDENQNSHILQRQKPKFVEITGRNHFQFTRN
jgi:hypothetical protein